LLSAAQQIKAGGVFAVSLYRRTAIDRFWVAEKRFYTNASNAVRSLIRGVFKFAYLTSITLSGRNPWNYLRNYGGDRGMDWSHDVHDWLGGFPYESIEADELAERMKQLGFVQEKAIVRPVAVFGLFGAPCNEYLFRKATA
jgi:2-polyprenyl-6-hydroxyphenyl methylase/3-demethylubiquinone-9 3-methyltransferase